MGVMRKKKLVGKTEGSLNYVEFPAPTMCRAVNREGGTLKKRDPARIFHNYSNTHPCTVVAPVAYLANQKLCFRLMPCSRAHGLFRFSEVARKQGYTWRIYRSFIVANINSIHGSNTRTLVHGCSHATTPYSSRCDKDEWGLHVRSFWACPVGNWETPP